MNDNNNTQVKIMLDDTTLKRKEKSSSDNQIDLHEVDFDFDS